MNLIFFVILALVTTSFADLIQDYSPAQIERKETLWR
jgi:hypothetical protein